VKAEDNLTEETLAAETLAEISQRYVVAVLRGPSLEATVGAVDALVAGGVTAIEITFTTPEAPAVIAAVAERFGAGILLGAGTVTSPEHAHEALEAGARFLVSPHTDDDVAAAMTATRLVTMLGALTPTEVVRARTLGAHVVKLFPGSLGGPGYLAALRAPFPDIPMMPTGGVSADNVADWMKAGAVAVGAGGNLCPAELMHTDGFPVITERATRFAAALHQHRAAAPLPP
jgi:2-dehydro-3-deoxyphosphogluconate aldolase/(4S)-4-hydroxy-2-oxoglutarate aldolase